MSQTRIKLRSMKIIKPDTLITCQMLQNIGLGSRLGYDDFMDIFPQGAIFTIENIYKYITQARYGCCCLDGFSLAYFTRERSKKWYLLHANILNAYGEKSLEIYKKAIAEGFYKFATGGGVKI